MGKNNRVRDVTKWKKQNRYIKKVKDDEVRSYLNDKRYKDPSLKSKVSMKCKCCGKNIEKHYWRIKTFKYCSIECKSKSLYPVLVKRLKNRGVHVDLVCQNPDCSKVFRRAISYVNHNVGVKYCSHKCCGHHKTLKSIEGKMLIMKKDNQDLNGLNINIQISDKDSFYNSILDLNRKK